MWVPSTTVGGFVSSWVVHIYIVDTCRESVIEKCKVCLAPHEMLQTIPTQVYMLQVEDIATQIAINSPLCAGVRGMKRG